MFNGLFTSLFGKSKENNIDSDVSNENNNQQQEPDVFDKENNILDDLDGNVRVILLDDDDKDWLFVETETQHPSLLSPSSEDKESSDKTTLSNNNLQLVPFKSILSHLSTVRENDENCLLSANLPSLFPNTMDESWFVTPPSCFSMHEASIQLEPSPFENLLIEHPSMSVYHRKPLAGINTDDIEDLVVLELSNNDNGETIIVNKGNKRNNRHKKSKSRGSNGNQRSVALVLVTKNPTASTGKAAEPRATAMSRSFIDRNNKAVRNSYKKNHHTINQPSSRTMSRKN